MAVVRVITFNDLISHLLDYMGASTSDESKRYATRAVSNAIREVASSRKWSYYYQHGRIVTVAPYMTGTVTYTQSNRLVTLSGGAFPSWAGQGVIQFGNIPYDVSERNSDTTLTLHSSTHPANDVSAPQAYLIYKDRFTLPCDFMAADEMINVNFFLPVTYQHPSGWMAMHRIIRGPATPRTFTITNDPQLYGTLAARFYPPPDNEYTLEFIYTRRPRSIGLDLLDGSVSVSADDPLDVEEGAMLTYLYRECERQTRMIKRMKAVGDEERQYAEAKFLAWEADSRSSERRVAGFPSYFRQRLRDMPRGPDIS